MARGARAARAARLAGGLEDEHPMIAASGVGLMAQLRVLYDRDPSVFQADGPQAARLASLGWTMIVVATIVFLLVMAVLLIPLWRRRNAPRVDGPPTAVNERAWVLYGGTAAPALVLAGAACE